MNSQKVTDDFTVSPQILPDDVHDIALAGFKSIICNRPDGESADQTPYRDIEAKAKAAGLEFRYIPVVSGAMTQEDVNAMASALGGLPVPVFAYCRSGARCGVLYRAVQAKS